MSRPAERTTDRPAPRGAGLAGLVHLVRPQNCLAAGLAVVLGAHLSSADHQAGPARIGAAMLVVGLILAASYVVNDLRDADADSLGNPGRALPSGRVTHRQAVRLFVGLAAAGCLLAAGFRQLDLFAMAVLCLVAGVVYSYRLKGTVLVGNAFVGLVASMPVLYGSLAAGSPTVATGFAAVLMFLFIFADEVLKAIGDREADDAAGLRTVGTRLGLQGGLRVFRVLALGFVVAATLPVVLGQAGILYLYGMAIGAVGPTLWTVVLLTRRPVASSIPPALRVSKAVWFTGLWALWFLA